MCGHGMVTTRSQAFDAAMRDFLRALHARVRGRCFTSGAWVLQLPPSARVQQFLDGLRRASSRRPIARTHDGFQKPQKLARHRVCGTRCAVDARSLQAGSQYEYRLSPPLDGLCGAGDAARKGVVLWYTFQLGVQRYLYLKLESHASTSPAHALAAVRRYVLKRSKATPYETRREDAYKDDPRGLAQRVATAAARNLVLWPQHAAEARQYDASARTGLELFVPGAVFASLLR